MFYYKSNRKTSKLEVSVQQSFSEMDFERMVFFIETFIEDLNDSVIFNVLPELHEYLQYEINIHNQQLPKYNIIVNLA
ncbi:hypothetical protein EV196_10664 [Mariniflexile fucanivorans]|uniref:Uncharacterized protein n=1 Tax=Mariniflexile fucanivorans TaxID=264023 RepID=A0A4R1RG21_9FLAO|nr:hypothetical protein [Mariniflexile fucanivorans]TCL64876.1 hypothetical protein EV196_10664 [Mariniflexile fucanivorans]